MPSVKIPKKSTDNDMTPFVDVAFLILTFFIMATKFKPAEAVEITTPYSVSSKELEEKDAILVSLDKDGRVFFTMQSATTDEPFTAVIQNLNETRELNLTDAEMASFVRNPTVGVPFEQLKQYLALSEDEQKKVTQPGIPVDSANNQLYYWVRDAVSAFSGKKLNYLIKGDNSAKYPKFKDVLTAFKRNDIYKFELITTPEDLPIGSEQYKKQQAALKGQ